jgi:hypothetical protein
MKGTKVCIVTMIGPLDIIGGLATDVEPNVETIFATLRHPCTLQVRPPNIVLQDMTRGSAVIGGDSILINMRAVLYISEPATALLSAYQGHCAGILVPQAKIQVDQPPIQ